MSRRATLLALALALLLATVVLAGCGGSSTQTPETKPAATEPAESGPAESGESAQPAEFPPAPADVSGMKAWFEKAYPGAAWLGRIKKVEYVAGEVPDSGGFHDAIVVTTDLDFKTEQPLAQEITNAIGEAHPAWAKQQIIRYADGNNITAGDIVDMTP